MSQNFTEEENKVTLHNDSISTSSRHLQSLKFSAATRRLPLLFFLIFMGVAVMVAGALAHNRADWQAFWNQEAVLERSRALAAVPLGELFDALATRINRIFVKGGWIVAGTLIILVQFFYLFLVIGKRDRTPELRFIRGFKLREMAGIEVAVLLIGTGYFSFCIWAFNWIAERIGSCTVGTQFTFPSSQSACVNGTFRGFDISGHCFLIVHSCLLALEYAAKLLFVWRAKERASSTSIPYEDNDKDSDIESLTDQPPEAEISLKSNDIVTRNYTLLHVLLTILLSAVALLCLAEFFVFLQTILFYHTVLEKLLGTFIGAWFWIGLFILSLRYPHLF